MSRARSKLNGYKSVSKSHTSVIGAPGQDWFADAMPPLEWRTNGGEDRMHPGCAMPAGSSCSTPRSRL